MESSQPPERFARRVGRCAQLSPTQYCSTVVALRTSSSTQATSSKGVGEPESWVSQPPTFSALGLNFFQFSGASCYHTASMEAGGVFAAGQRADRKAGCVIERKTKLTEHLLCTLPTQPIGRPIVCEEGQSHFG